jgi:hypothetical protein
MREHVPVSAGYGSGHQLILFIVGLAREQGRSFKKCHKCSVHPHHIHQELQGKNLVDPSTHKRPLHGPHADLQPFKPARQFKIPDCPGTNHARTILIHKVRGKQKNQIGQPLPFH